MRWSSSSCRMLLQMSCSSFSTCRRAEGQERGRQDEQSATGVTHTGSCQVCMLKGCLTPIAGMLQRSNPGYAWRLLGSSGCAACCSCPARCGSGRAVPPQRPGALPALHPPARPTHHFAVGLDALHMLLVALGLLLLLDARDDAPGGAAGANDVLVRHRQQVPLLHRQLLVVHHLCHLLHLRNLHHRYRTGENGASAASDRTARPPFHEPLLVKPRRPAPSRCRPICGAMPRGGLAPLIAAGRPWVANSYRSAAIVRTISS
jgi:hypothetical protein